MLVSQSNPVGVEPFSFEKLSFFFPKIYIAAGNVSARIYLYSDSQEVCLLYNLQVKFDFMLKLFNLG